jgi:hypothetical protein
MCDVVAGVKRIGVKCSIMPAIRRRHLCTSVGDKVSVLGNIDVVDDRSRLLFWEGASEKVGACIPSLSVSKFEVVTML